MNMKENTMKNYMVIILTDEGEQIVNFFDKYQDAENCRMNSECGMGWYAEVYAREEIESGIRAYSLI